MVSTELLVGDARTRLRELSSRSVDLIITSPPYGSIIEYSSHRDQIGFNQSLQQYYRSLQQVFEECVRILKPGCRLVVNIGDEFIRSSADCDFQIIPHHAKIIQLLHGQLGLKYMGDVIWSKVTRSSTNGGAKILGSVDRPRTAHHFVNHEYVLIFTKPGQAAVPQGTLGESTFSLEQRQKWFTDTWTIAAEKTVLHPAAFPLELAERLVQMYSYVGELVLDPFAGSGTTLLAAAMHDRDSIGVELGFGPGWQEVVRSRLQRIKIIR